MVEAGAPPADDTKPAPQQPEPAAKPPEAATSPTPGQAPAAVEPPAGAPAAAPSAEPGAADPMDDKVGLFYRLLADGEMAPYFDGVAAAAATEPPPATSAVQPQAPSPTPAAPDADLRNRAEAGDAEALATIGKQSLDRERATVGQATAEEATAKATLAAQQATLQRLGMTQESLTGPEMRKMAEGISAGKPAFDMALAVYSDRAKAPAPAAADPGAAAAAAPAAEAPPATSNPEALADYGRRLAQSQQAPTPAVAGGQAVTSAPPPDPMAGKTPGEVIEEALEAETAAAASA